jgi:hypothetical protein
MGALTVFLGSLTWYPTGRLGLDEMSLQGAFLRVCGGLRESGNWGRTIPTVLDHFICM